MIEWMPACNGLTMCEILKYEIDMDLKRIWFHIENLQIFINTNNWNIKCKLLSDAGDSYCENGVWIPRSRTGTPQPWCV